MKKIKAKVAILQSPGKMTFEFKDLSMNVKENNILCESLVSVISPGTELAAYRGAPPLSSSVSYPRFVGYCNVARVIAKGGNVKNISVGDRVLSLQSHRSHFQINSSEILAVVPSQISSREAACCYLFQLGYNATLRGNVRLGSNVIVLGMGALGLTTVAMSTLAGGRVFGISDYAEAKRRVCELGAIDCFSRSNIDSLFTVLGDQLAHVVVSTTSAWTDWSIALNAAGDQGTIVVLGFPGRESNSIPLNPLESATFYKKQLRVIAAGHSPLIPEPKGFLPFNLRDNILRILSWISAGDLSASTLLSGDFHGLALNEAYESLIQRRNAAITYALIWRDDE
jgi:threonine dehydrogenase-like Zn-dependent dehydrogenase